MSTVSATKTTTRPRALRVCAAGLLVGIATAPAMAADWSDTSVGYRTSNKFTEPSNPERISKDIYSFTHVSGYKYGVNFFTADFLQSDDKDPANGGGGGAQEVYAVYRHTLSLSAVSGVSMKFGPIKDLGLTAGIDRNAKDDAFAPRVRKTVLGPTIMFDVPGFFNASFLLRKERNHNGIVGKSVDFDDTFGVVVARIFDVRRRFVRRQERHVLYRRRLRILEQQVRRRVRPRQRHQGRDVGGRGTFLTNATQRLLWRGMQ